MNWREMLTDIFAGYVNQQTLDDASDQMVFVSSDNLRFHTDFLNAIEKGLEAARSDDTVVCDIINKSGYRASTTQEACDLLLELRRIYVDKYQQAVLARESKGNNNV